MPDTKNFEWGVKDLIGHGSYGFVYKVSEIHFIIVVFKMM